MLYANAACRPLLYSIDIKRLIKCQILEKYLNFPCFLLVLSNISAHVLFSSLSPLSLYLLSSPPYYDIFALSLQPCGFGGFLQLFEDVP